ncbi:MAG: hypothetical protein MRT15_11215 [archaeon YNP-LCB-003-016]|uniref:hypothetical protein n=1 Tax=Candidatus Culexarchaeum yellowstonense TaxID=2928963 RepID=UPI0026EC3496|nr:hypothetical protein [Candidatus Culexarchaeum yellowstonense]MCR6692953.1 hypothetical protein [Candidatus Culexarchaeum yellowstonense]
MVEASGEVNVGEVDLNTFIRYKPKFVRIEVNEEKILGVASKTQKVGGKTVNFNMVFETKIPITITVIRWNTNEERTPAYIRIYETDNLLTLLAHKPERLEIEYWANNSCQLLEDKGLKNETIVIQGVKGKKTYTVTYHNLYETPFQRLAIFK